MDKKNYIKTYKKKNASKTFRRNAVLLFFVFGKHCLFEFRFIRKVSLRYA